MDLKALTAKARELEENHKHRFSFTTHFSFPSPRKERATGHFYYACRDCQRQLYLLGDKILGSAINGAECSGA